MGTMILALTLDSILKSRNISLLTKVHLVKAMVFPVVVYGCESWTVIVMNLAAQLAIIKQLSRHESCGPAGDYLADEQA